MYNRERKIVSYVVNECVKSPLRKEGIYKSKICHGSLLMLAFFNVSSLGYIYLTNLRKRWYISSKFLQLLLTNKSVLLRVFLEFCHKFRFILKSAMTGPQFVPIGIPTIIQYKLLPKTNKNVV